MKIISWQRDAPPAASSLAANWPHSLHILQSWEVKQLSVTFSALGIQHTATVFGQPVLDCISIMQASQKKKKKRKGAVIWYGLKENNSSRLIELNYFLIWQMQRKCECDSVEVSKWTFCWTGGWISKTHQCRLTGRESRVIHSDHLYADLPGHIRDFVSCGRVASSV